MCIPQRDDQHVVMNRSPCTVLHFASGDLWAGAEAQLFTLARKLADNPDISVEVVLLNHGRLEQNLRRAGVSVTVIDEATTGPLMILVQLTRIIQHSGARILHTHRTKENILGSIAGLLAGGVPSIRTVHGAPEHKPSLKQAHKYLVNVLDNICARFLQKSIVAVSNDLVSRLDGTLPRGKLCVIENGIDPTEFAAQKQSRQNRINDRQGAVKIGIAGRLVPVKRVDLFLRTVHYMKNNHPELSASYHIYGDGPLRVQLEQSSRELGVSHLVHFEGHRPEICTELASLDILMMTSDHEGTPMVLLEALALGVPVIAHSTGGIIEVLDHGKCGILVDDHTACGYASQLAEIMDSSDRYAMRGQQAICRHLDTRFSATRNAEQYLSLYKKLTGWTPA
jgi:glycosyltransferase involved in cell wall biosynthesis